MNFLKTFNSNTCLIMFLNVLVLQQGKKAEIAQKIEQVRNGVTEFTSSIEEMKTIRDTKLAGINKLQKELQVCYCLMFVGNFL